MRGDHRLVCIRSGHHPTRASRQYGREGEGGGGGGTVRRPPPAFLHLLLSSFFLLSCHTDCLVGLVIRRPTRGRQTWV